MTRPEVTDKGAAAILVAGALVFLMGMAALSVDTSGFYQTARVGQTTADLACLAGAAELPDTDDAIDVAHAYSVANWPEMAGAFLPANGNPRTATDGNGNTIYYEAGYGGDADVLYVAINDRDPTTFGRVIGSESVDIAQEAACEREIKLGGPSGLPMAALPGTFNGALHDCENKKTGNCGAIDVGSGGNAWRDAIANGWDQQLQKHHGDESNADPDTGSAVVHCPSAGPCSANDTETGNMQGPFRQGLTMRFANVAGADCVIGGNFNCDDMEDVLGSPASTLSGQFGASAPGWWEPSLYGPYGSVRNSQYYFDGDIEKCDSPRLGVVPIMAWDLDWDLGDGSTSWPNGKKEMKIVGLYVIHIREPDTPGEMGSGPIIADVIHLGPNATCDGVPYTPHQTGLPIESVKLVQS